MSRTISKFMLGPVGPYAGDIVTSETSIDETLQLIVNAVGAGGAGLPENGNSAQYLRGDKTWVILNKAAVGLGNVDNTSDVDKPLSLAAISALSAKEDSLGVSSAGYFLRGDRTWQAIGKSTVGLANVDNTADVDKPISVLVQSALNGKEPSLPTGGTTATYLRGDKTWATLGKIAVGLSNVDNTSDANKPISTATQTALNAKEAIANRGAANGYAPLGADGKVPSINLPDNGSYKGNWNANTNTPTITAGTGTNGDTYTVSVAGTQSVTGTSTTFAVGDQLKFTTNGNKWERIPNTQAVASVAGLTGTIAPADLKTALAVTKSDVGLSNVDNTSDANKPVSTATQTALDAKASTAVVTTTVNGLMAFADKVKLNGVATGATANDTDVNLKNRANHTGTQAISTIVNLQSTLDSKQDSLTSASNIKTVGGLTILGSGDLGTIGLAYGGTGSTTAPGARASLGLGSAATENTGISGATIPLLSNANTWGAAQTAPEFLITRVGQNIDAGLTISADSGRLPQVLLRTGTTPNWMISRTSITGTNVGGNLILGRYDDAGSWLGGALEIERQSATAYFSGTVSTKSVNVTGADANGGGRITLAKATTGSLAGAVVLDVTPSSFRIYEGAGTARGWHLDITSGGTSASKNIVDRSNHVGSQAISTITNLQSTIDAITTKANRAQGNLLYNGGLEDAFRTGVRSSGGLQYYNTGEWGPVAISGTSGTYVFEFDYITDIQIGSTYWFHVDPIAFGSSGVYCDLICYAADGSILLDGTENLVVGPYNFSGNDTRRGQIASSIVVPIGTVRIMPRVVTYVVSNNTAGFRRAKVESGPTWTPFTSERTLSVAMSSLSTLETFRTRYRNSYVSVLDFAAAGQVPSDGSNWTPAFQAALATGKNVFVPRGTYSIRDSLRINNPGQQLFGVNGGVSVLTIDGSYANLNNPVIIIENQTDGNGNTIVEVDETHAGVDNIGMYFYHAGYTSRSQLLDYSWAIYCKVTRPFIGDIRINGAMRGIALGTGNNKGAGCIGGTWEIGAFGQGLLIDSTLDTIHINTIRFWPYGCANPSDGTQAVYHDGTTIGALFGACDGMDIKTLMTLGPKLLFSKGTRSDGATAFGTFGNITTLHIDTAIDTLNFEAGQIQVSNMYMSIGGIAKYGDRYAIRMSETASGSSLLVSNVWLLLSPDTTVPPIRLDSGTLMMTNCHVRGFTAAGTSIVKQNGGMLFLDNWNITQGTDQARSAPFIDISGGRAVLENIALPAIGTGSGLSLRITANNDHSIKWTIPGGWPIQLPTGTLTGYYDCGSFQNKPTFTVNRV